MVRANSFDIVRAFFLVKIDTSSYEKEGKERRQKAALKRERKVKHKQIYGANDLNEHGEAVPYVPNVLVCSLRMYGIDRELRAARICRANYY